MTLFCTGKWGYSGSSIFVSDLKWGLNAELVKGSEMTLTCVKLSELIFNKTLHHSHAKWTTVLSLRFVQFHINPALLSGSSQRLDKTPWATLLLCYTPSWLDYLQVLSKTVPLMLSKLALHCRSLQAAAFALMANEISLTLEPWTHSNNLSAAARLVRKIWAAILSCGCFR